MGRKVKPRMIPEQDRRICGSICFCQLTVVMSCVALVYLTVAIYMPSHRAFKSGIQVVPVTCQTVNSTLVGYCSWASCGEWCLTKTAGFCPQIHVTVRRNGTDALFENCTQFNTFSCPQVNPEKLKRYNCNNGTECGALSGLFNCSLGHCANMSEIYDCHHKADGILIDSEKDNMKLNGFFECNKSRCIKVKNAFSCDRLCEPIITSSANLYLLHGNNVGTANCRSVVAYNSENGSFTGNTTEIVEGYKGALFTSCRFVYPEGNNIRASDCINGTFLSPSRIPEPRMNFTTLWELTQDTSELVDPTQRYLAMQAHLTIYNYSRLYINLEACVNTLQGECRDFLATHGNDGDNNTAQSRFTCYYDKNSLTFQNDSFFVVARFDLRKTWRELMIAVLVPSTLFLISTATLCVITRSVNVGDDAKMRCKYCNTGADNEACQEESEDEDDDDQVVGVCDQHNFGNCSRDSDGITKALTK